MQPGAYITSPLRTKRPRRFKSKRAPALEFAYNNSVQKSTGKTPFYLTYRMHPRTPFVLLSQQSPGTHNTEADAFVVDLQAALADGKEATVDAQERQKEYVDRRRRDVPFAPGDRVWLDAKYLKLQA